MEETKKEFTPRPERSERPQRGRRRRKVCAFCVDKVEHVDYKDAAKLRKYMSERGKILPRRMTGTCAHHQRQLTEATGGARPFALLLYTGGYFVFTKKKGYTITIKLWKTVFSFALRLFLGKGEDFLDGQAEHLRDIHRELERGVILPVFQPADGFTAHADQLGQPRLVHALRGAQFLDAGFQHSGHSERFS